MKHNCNPALKIISSDPEVGDLQEHFNSNPFFCGVPVFPENPIPMGWEEAGLEAHWVIQYTSMADDIRPAIEAYLQFSVREYLGL